MRRYPSSPRPPATPTEAAAFVRDYAVKLYDKQDGQGVNWRVIAEALGCALFDVLDKLAGEVCKSVAGRVHDGAYERMANGPKADSTASNSSPAGAENAPSNTTGLKSPRPRPPKGAV